MTSLRRLAQLVALLWMAACAEQAVEQPSGGQMGAFVLLEDPPVPSLSTIVHAVRERSGTEQGEGRGTTRDADPASRVPSYVCERFEVRMREGGRSWHRRLRRTWTEADRVRFRSLVELVAKEMGAEPRLLELWALRESTYNPYAIHVLNPDLEASATSWRKHRWDPERAAQLEESMAALGARDPEYWQAKAELARISRFRGNDFYDALVEFEVVDRDGARARRRTSYWGYGYGPYGFNPTYFLATWDAEAPPWVFCNDDGLAAIVTAIWAAREHQRECESLGFEGSYEVVNRRFSAGHCAARPKADRRFGERARRRGLAPESEAKLGRDWPADASDRAVLLEHLRTKAAAEGLLSRYALEERELARFRPNPPQPEVGADATQASAHGG
ncbi:hypothetical protein G6O69_08655 [Pseudenhygromyxa sp. WMMC2535]|uniref:hypothetical protein n=1 Tax=Pseudenhygromyxa sp. WMMC2535 TaxID=2712867 RepID=UPI0015518C04|nr:hypothetical protein [Pseudenhygromyxa sp. WMMC2535]NVB37903.1 hypothetical protein [Pseudenhygromyxa sp. WMMC2535]